MHNFTCTGLKILLVFYILHGLFLSLTTCKFFFYNFLLRVNLLKNFYLKKSKQN